MYYFNTRNIKSQNIKEWSNKNYIKKYKDVFVSSECCVLFVKS